MSSMSDATGELFGDPIASGFDYAIWVPVRDLDPEAIEIGAINVPCPPLHLWQANLVERRLELTSLIRRSPPLPRAAYLPIGGRTHDGCPAMMLAVAFACRGR